MKAGFMVVAVRLQFDFYGFVLPQMDWLWFCAVGFDGYKLVAVREQQGGEDDRLLLHEYDSPQHSLITSSRADAGGYSSKRDWAICFHSG